MRLPTVSQFRDEMGVMSKQLDQIQVLQAQVSTGKKLQYASDNPLLAEKISGINDFIQTVKAYQLNGTLAENRTSVMSSAVQKSINTLDRVQELIKNSDNDTLNNNDRTTLALELKNCLDNFLQIANSQDNNGDYIFSGINSHTPSYAKVNQLFKYQGSSDITNIAISSQNTVPYNESGYSVFGDIKTGNGLFTVSADQVNNTGTGILSAGGVSQNTAYIADDYRITFVTNGAGKLAYQIIGLSSGQVVPLPPLLTPDDAPEYIADNQIAFNGINVQISDNPHVGDVFIITPSKTDSIFNFLQKAINTLMTPVNSDKGKADLHQALSGLSANFQQASQNFNQFMVEIGTRGKSIDDQINLSKANVVDQQILLGKLSDADMTEVISDLTQRLTTLQVTQQSYLKIQEVFNGLLQR